MADGFIRYDFTVTVTAVVVTFTNFTFFFIGSLAPKTSLTVEVPYPAQTRLTVSEQFRIGICRVMFAERRSLNHGHRRMRGGCIYDGGGPPAATGVMFATDAISRCSDSVTVTWASRALTDSAERHRHYSLRVIFAFRPSFRVRLRDRRFFASDDVQCSRFSTFTISCETGFRKYFFFNLYLDFRPRISFTGARRWYLQVRTDLMYNRELRIGGAYRP